MNEWRHSQSNTHTHTQTRTRTHTLLVNPCLPLLSAFCECAKSAIYEFFDCKSSWPKPRFVIIFKSFLFVLPTGSGAEKTYDAYDMQSVCRARWGRLDGIRFYGQVKKNQSNRVLFNQNRNSSFAKPTVAWNMQSRKKTSKKATVQCARLWNTLYTSYQKDFSNL